MTDQSSRLTHLIDWFTRIVDQRKSLLVQFVIIAAAVAGATWTICEELRVKPLEQTTRELTRKLDDCSKLKSECAPPITPTPTNLQGCIENGIGCTPRTSVTVLNSQPIDEGDAVHTADGRCFIWLKDKRTLVVTVEQTPQTLPVNSIPHTVYGSLGTYVIQIERQRTRPNGRYAATITVLRNQP